MKTYLEVSDLIESMHKHGISYKTITHILRDYGVTTTTGKEVGTPEIHMVLKKLGLTKTLKPGDLVRFKEGAITIFPKDCAKCDARKGG